MRARRWARVGLWVVGGVAALSFLYVAITFVQVWNASRHDQDAATEAIVVLGAAQYDGEPSPVFQARLDHAAELYDAGAADMIVLTGGKQPGDRFTEGYSGFRYLVDQGLPESALVLEDQGTNTWEQLAAASRILDERGRSAVLLVSDPYHSFRLAATAEELGLDPQVSPAASGASFGNLVRETAAVSVGRIIGYGRLERLDERR
jgi:uncharacterized SAM-binding protein YcdF (DUF218 family)